MNQVFKVSTVTGYQMTKPRLKIVDYSFEHFTSDPLNFSRDGQFELIDGIWSSSENPVLKKPPKENNQVA